MPKPPIVECADLVTVGRALIVNPEWVRKVESGRFAELSTFHRDALATLI